MERNSKKRRLSPFAAICILVSAAALLLTALFIVRLNGYMEIYENAQPGRLAQQIYDTYYRGTPDYGKITEMAGCVLTSGESRDTLVRYLLEKQGGRELEMVRVSSAEKDTARYVLMAGDVKISAFNLRQGEEVRFSSLFGSFTKLLWLFSCYEWKLDRVELFYSATEQVAVRAPWSATVYVNGQPLGEDKIEGEVEWTESAAHMPDGVKGLGYVTYYADGYLYPPTVRVVSSSGRELEVRELGDRYFGAEDVYDEELRSRMSEWVLRAVETYACFMQEDASFKDVAPYLDPDSVLYERVRTTERFVWDHDSYRFENVSTADYYAYDENTFSCTVEFQHVLVQGKKEWRDTPLSLTVYCRKIGGNYVIYDMVNR